MKKITENHNIQINYLCLEKTLNSHISIMNRMIISNLIVYINFKVFQKKNPLKKNHSLS